LGIRLEIGQESHDNVIILFASSHKTRVEICAAIDDFTIRAVGASRSTLESANEKPGARFFVGTKSLEKVIIAIRACQQVIGNLDLANAIHGSREHLRDNLRLERSTGSVKDLRTGVAVVAHARIKAGWIIETFVIEVRGVVGADFAARESKTPISSDRTRRCASATSLAVIIKCGFQLGAKAIQCASFRQYGRDATKGSSEGSGRQNQVIVECVTVREETRTHIFTVDGNETERT
jgi:hypothetical protein